MEINFSASAIEDLIKLRELIALSNPQAAERTSVLLQQAIAKLTLYPDMGSPVEELESVRELVAGNYVIRYLRSDEEIIVLRIWHNNI